MRSGPSSKPVSKRTKPSADASIRRGFSESIRQEMIRIDGHNTAWLLELIQELGWIDVERFGLDAFEDAF